MWAAASASITTAAVPPTTAARTTRWASTRAMWSTTWPTFATRRRCRIPTLISESGRAIVAHHSVLIVDIFRRDRKDEGEGIRVAARCQAGQARRRSARFARDPESQETAANISTTPCRSRTMRRRGSISACSTSRPRRRWRRSSGKSPRAWWNFSSGLEVDAGGNPRPEGFAGRPVPLQFLGLPIVARSLGARTAFPHRADPPAQRGAGAYNATLVDITCDSDGKISKFIDSDGEVSKTLPLHALNGKPYYLGMFFARRLPGHHGRTCTIFSVA